MERAGNVLGELTAEADERMLKAAFFESRNYRELARGTDFRFVVGRRGTGKSALFNKVSEALREEKGVLLANERPTEEKARAFQDELGRLSSGYLDTRIVSKLTWKIQILTQAMEQIQGHYRATRVEHLPKLVEYRAKHDALFKETGLARSLGALRTVLRTHPGLAVNALPEAIADYFELRWLENEIVDALKQIRRRLVFLYDGLDEGWVPSQVATGLLGGLAMAAAGFRENQAIHCLLFIRDNMFRALAEFDGDYSRNIEGNTLRLHWDEESLLGLVALRLRVAFDWKGENNIKAWNRFAQRGLEGLEGFRKCLKLTLYRPRDVIALLNGAHQLACAHDRDEIIDSDVEATATTISQTRFSDLLKEYEQVLPGLPLFAQVFRGCSARMEYAEVLGRLDTVVEQVHFGASARDFALLRTGADAFNALYSVGFFGVQDADSTVRFCHDGSNTDVQEVAANRTIVVHPCYWRALSLTAEPADEVTVAVDDEDDVTRGEPAKKQMEQIRLRKLGRIVEELHKIPEGQSGARAFEEWVYDAARYLFATGLDNIQWKPNPGLVQQRDVVGALRDPRGFWRRVEAYDVKQFIIEVKNFRLMDVDVFRQAWGYLAGPYGRCLMVVTRSEDDGIGAQERALVKEGYDLFQKLVILMPARLLQRALSKMRSGNERRDGYIQDLLKKRMDTFERSYVAQKSARAPIS